MTSIPMRDRRTAPLAHFFGEVESALDTAHDLVAQGRLKEWDSVLVKSQTSGRGQLRRHWESPPGNLYGALRLPMVSPFSGSAASVAVGALFANAIASLGCQVNIKWPNDLILVSREFPPLKIGGILLEDRDGALVAGIGVNISEAPKYLRPESALGAGSLDCSCHMRNLELAHLWLALVKHVHSVYKHGAFFSDIWRSLATELLLWRGERVELRDHDEVVIGVLRGIGENGGILLEFPDGRVEERLSGETRACQDQNS